MVSNHESNKTIVELTVNSQRNERFEFVFLAHGSVPDGALVNCLVVVQRRVDGERVGGWLAPRTTISHLAFDHRSISVPLNDWIWRATITGAAQVEWFPFLGDRIARRYDWRARTDCNNGIG